MTLVRASELQASGDLVGAEDIYWSEIETGNDYARLLLAFMFHDAGLLTLAAEHYQVLLETQYRTQAAPQLSSILLRAHRYFEAREVLSDLDATDSLDAIESVENKTLTDQIEYPNCIENLLEEERILLSQQVSGITLENQIQLCRVRNLLAEYSSRIASGKATVAASTQIQLHPGIQVVVKKALLAPTRRWFELAHAQTILFTLTSEVQNSEDEFANQVVEAFNSLQIKFLFSGRTLTEEGEDWVVNNLTWGLQQIDHPAQSFLPD